MPSTGDYVLIGLVVCAATFVATPLVGALGSMAGLALRAQRPHGAHVADPRHRRSGHVLRLRRCTRGRPPARRLRQPLRPQLRTAGRLGGGGTHHVRRAVGRHQGAVGPRQGDRNRHRRARPRLVRREHVLLPAAVPRGLLPLRRLDPADHRPVAAGDDAGDQPHRRAGRPGRRHRRHRCRRLLPLQPEAVRRRPPEPAQPRSAHRRSSLSACAWASSRTTSVRRASSWGTAGPCSSAC